MLQRGTCGGLCQFSRASGPAAGGGVNMLYGSPGREAAGCCGICVFLPPSRASSILAEKAMSRGRVACNGERRWRPALTLPPPGLHCAS